VSSSRQLTLIGLLALAAIVPWWLHDGFGWSGTPLALAAGILPLLAVGYFTWRRTRNWSGITALCMIPYAALGMMDIVASSGALLSGVALGSIAIANFFLVLDAGRRER
jgi:hypothetical protein